MSGPKKKGKKYDPTGRDQIKSSLKRLKEYKIGSDIQGYAEYVERWTRWTH